MSEQKENKYDWWINVEDIIPSLGKTYKFAAKAIIHQIGMGEIRHDLGETWGETKDEADEKMREKIQDWLKQH